MRAPTGIGSFNAARLSRWIAAALLLHAMTVSGCSEQVNSPTAPESAPALAATTTALTFAQVSSGNYHACGVTTDHIAYCWGYNAYGQLGDGTTTLRRTPVAVASGLRFRQVSTGDFHTCGVT